MFDIYLDFRQRTKYKIINLPESFVQGYKLSDSIDKKCKKGEYELQTDQEQKGEIDLAGSVNSREKVNQLFVISDSENQQSELLIESKRVEEEVKSDSSLINKITNDFKNGQKYNKEHMIVPIAYKLFRAIFWIGFWIGLLPERMWTFNMQLIFPDGCTMDPFWADVCLAFIFEIELNFLHQIYMVSLLYYNNFVIQKKYGFLR